MTRGNCKLVCFEIQLLNYSPPGKTRGAVQTIGKSYQPQSQHVAQKKRCDLSVVFAIRNEQQSLAIRKTATVDKNGRYQQIRYEFLDD